MYFREKVVQLRKDASMTQDYFAKAVGVSRQAVYKWEKGKSYPEAEKLILIAKLFGVTVDSLLEDDFQLFSLVLPGVGEEKKVKKAAVKKPASKEAPVVEPIIKEEPVVEKIDIAAANIAAEKAAVKEPASIKSAAHKPQSKKQSQPQSIFGGIRGLFGRKK